MLSMLVYEKESILTDSSTGGEDYMWGTLLSKRVTTQNGLGPPHNDT